ncbi:MAG TPA: hypothetical protein PLL30_10975 [Candidatus Krumholzibacteria bacterium]|nr:hypothetical protein [Candidatus Krumholzibacteria bacterium]HPD72287.1 hypothetical protein [Candidatus Krumholzibacteria bacterium]HRY40781.1 hypothetical protein [Candidatus Krumholzibacteria bacterium]
MVQDLRPKRLRLVVIPLAVIVAAWIGIGLWIGGDVRVAARDAQARFGGGAVAALSAVATSVDAPLDERNRAIWALGQLGDPAALPVLERLQTGAGCQHDRAVCQREVHKAIAACRGGFNVSAVLWRHTISG